ncbi:MAG: leucine-rich repeat domain-containing protein [Acutalibacteraceae bacterium]
MKKRQILTKILLPMLILIISLTTVTSLAALSDLGDTYDESEYTIIDNVVYSWTTDSKNKKYYSVIAFGATKAIREKMTEINIVSEIDGIPVTRIEAEDDVSPRMLYPNVKEITIPDSIKYIGTGAFRGLLNIKSIKLPKDLEYIGSYVFLGLKQLEEINIPEKITKIPDFSFRDCTNLHTVTIEGDIVSIGDYAFYNCSKIKSFYLPETLKKIGHGAFTGTDLRSITIPSKTILDSYGEDGSSIYGTFSNCKNLKTVVFENRKDTVYLPDNLFNGCTSLETVVLPASATVFVGNRAFKSCTKLNTIVNSGRISNISEAAFAYCKSLSSIRLSSKINVIESKAFLGCSNLTSITFTGTKSAPDIKGKKVFYDTPDGIKFIVKNTTVAKSLKTELKNSGVKNAKIYTGPSYKLTYKNVK